MVAAVDGAIPVYLDSGIRRGTDILMVKKKIVCFFSSVTLHKQTAKKNQKTKALALGAEAVFIGRPMLYGLAYKVKKKKATPPIKKKNGSPGGLS